ncbi:helix-turn-helix transcriptional regulator [Diaphorobacter sp. HDW4B]|uniref:helix-turn-helix transcriptional regulator n=1 Tax=Diaphorobacter sp. HDW4B TaxID=2714925 RepID=UPI00140A1FB7|nr:AraC family transcriptional regulator [Diaphorobacter sp. HDW4B]QIL72088.1 helix-turn-helix transcriptional regulator [Diaphorobacter sp. HDW4B]
MSSLAFNKAPTNLRAMAADGDSVPAIPTAPQYGSAAFQWNGFILERHLLPAGTLQTTVMTSHCLAIPRSPVPTPIRWQLNNQRIDGAMSAGKVYFRAAGDELASTWENPLDAVFVSISPDTIGLAHEEAFRGKPALHSNLSGANDFGLAQLVLELDTHIQGSRVGGALFEQSALLACGLRLASLYALSGPATERPTTGTLARHTLARLDDFILSHLTEPLTINAIADAVNMSVYHLCRKFRKTRQVSLWQYVLMCRIAYARRLMQRNPDMPLLDVALACGFDSYTQFFEAFRKFCGMSPRNFGRRVA